jgi:hypothetical protein
MNIVGVGIGLGCDNASVLPTRTCNLTSSTKRSLAGTRLSELCRDTGRAVWALAFGIVFTATVEVRPGTPHEGLEMLEAEMSKALVPEQQLLLRTSEIPIGIVQDVGEHTERVVQR